MYDLEVPIDSYHREIKKLKASNEELKNSKELVSTLFFSIVVLNLVLDIIVELFWS